jgi:predicted esterase
MPGYGNSPEDFKKFFIKRINFTKKNDTTIIILRSPINYVSVQKSKNHSWFDIYNFPLDNFSDINLEDLKKSAKILEGVVNNEVNLLNGNYEKIIVGGHSQGAAVSLYQAYTSKKKYGGVFAFSGFLSPGEINDDKRNMKVYFGYGDKDDVIIPSFINKTLEKVMNFEGFDLHIYKDHKHYVHENQTTDVGIFIDNLIK